MCPRGSVGAPGPLCLQGCTCGPGLLVWKALHACRAGKSVPVPEPGPPPTPAPGRGGAHKAPLFLPWNEWIGGSQDRLSAGDTGDPTGQAEGRGTGGGMEGRTDRADADIASSGKTRSCASQGFAAPAAQAGSQVTLPAPCHPRDVPVPPSPRSSVTGHPRGWAGRDGLAHFRRGWKLEEWTLQRVSQLEEASVRCRHVGEGVVGFRQPRFIPPRVVPALLSCLTPSSLCKGHKPREKGASRAHRRCPALRAQPGAWAKTSPCHGPPI